MTTWLIDIVRHPIFWWLAVAFATNSFVFSALSVHLLPLLNRLGHSMETVVIIAAVYGMGNGVLRIVRGTVPQAIFGRENYGAISGALSGPSLLLKALGPVAVASLLGLTQSVEVVIAVLFASSICSLIACRSAVKIDQGNVAPGWSATKSR